MNIALLSIIINAAESEAEERRVLGPYMKAIIGHLWVNQSDSCGEVARAAIKAFNRYLNILCHLQCCPSSPNARVGEMLIFSVIHLNSTKVFVYYCRIYAIIITTINIIIDPTVRYRHYH